MQKQIDDLDVELNTAKRESERLNVLVERIAFEAEEDKTRLEHEAAQVHRIVLSQFAVTMRVLKLNFTSLCKHGTCHSVVVGCFLFSLSVPLLSLSLSLLCFSMSHIDRLCVVNGAGKDHV